MELRMSQERFEEYLTEAYKKALRDVDTLITNNTTYIDKKDYVSTSEIQASGLRNLNFELKNLKTIKYKLTTTTDTPPLELNINRSF